MSKRILTFTLMIFASLVRAQMPERDEPAMADSFRSDGKIYVVIAVIATIFAAILVFLIYLERRLKKAEDQIGSSTAMPDKEKEFQTRH
jgi:hypothetical protein